MSDESDLNIFYIIFFLIDDEEGNPIEGVYNVSTSDQDELLIDLVKSYPFLYDKTSKDHKDRNMKSNAWEEIAKVLNITG